MSEYAIVKIQIKDAIALKDALKEMGYEFEEHKEAQHLYGYEGRKRKQKAHIIVRRHHVGGSANDVGFLKNNNGEYEMIISEYDQRAGQQAKNFMGDLKQVYSACEVVRKAKSMGYVVKSRKTVDGDIKIKVQK